MEALAVRLTALEAQILTSEGKAAKRALKTQIMGAAKQLKKLADEHENVKSIWSQFDELHSQLDTLTGLSVDEKLMLPQIKEQIVLAGEKHLQETAAQLQTLDAIKGFVNTSHLQDLPAQTEKLKPLLAVHVTQKNQQGDLNERVFALLRSYNTIAEILSAKFVYWDTILSEAEARVASAIENVG